MDPYLHLQHEHSVLSAGYRGGVSLGCARVTTGDESLKGDRGGVQRRSWTAAVLQLIQQGAPKASVSACRATGARQCYSTGPFRCPENTTQATVRALPLTACIEDRSQQFIIYSSSSFNFLKIAFIQSDLQARRRTTKSTQQFK